MELAIVGRSAIRTQQKRLVAVFALLIVSAVSFLFSTDFQAEISINPNPVIRGRNIVFTILIDHETVSGLTMIMPELPAGIQHLYGPSIRPVRETGKNGIVQNRVKINYTFRGLKTGRFLIDSFVIKTSDNVFISDAKLLSVGIALNSSIHIPLEPEWVLLTERVFIGEAVPLLREVYEQEEILFFDNVGITAPKGGVFEQASALGQIQINNKADQVLYDLPIDAYIFTPSSTGRVIIPEASVNVNDIISKANSISIYVEAIPEEIRITGAIGEFAIHSWLEESSVTAGDEIILHVKISGEGNLNFFHIPDPVYKEGTLLSTREINNYSAGLNGYSGSRENVYRFINDSPGRSVISIPPFPRYNKLADEVFTDYGKSIEVLILPAEENQGTETKVPGIEHILDSEEGLDSGETGFFYKNRANHFWFLPGPVIFIFLLMRKQKILVFSAMLFLITVPGLNSDESDILKGLSAYKDGRFSDAIQLFESVLKTDPDNHKILSKIALFAYQDNNYSNALHALRSAVFYNPSSVSYRKSLEILEKEMKLYYQFSPAHHLHPDTFFVLLIVFLNGVFIVLGIRLFKKQGIFVILLVMMIFFAVLAGGGFLYITAQRGIETGIIFADGAELNKVPRTTSSKWITLLPGIAVRILGETTNYYLIETGEGMKGWVENNTILFDNSYF